ncbi:MAG: pectinesterase family protein [Duncaniella sp.]|nr:pectinesterase family protein [Muribaculum sp.]MCM1254723.1 pectinesterase family protein [Duncaniella sp.]
MMKIKAILIALLAVTGLTAAAQADKKYNLDIVVAQDGSGDYTTITESLEGIRAYMDYNVNVHIKNGVYKEKIVIPAWLTNVTFIGENPDSTIITWDDHANINKMGTFRTYTVKVDGDNITFRNLTIENNAPQLGQAVALHTEGDKLQFYNCRMLGNQDTLFTGGKNARLYFGDCYIEGTTDFIFGPATAYFKDCNIHSKRDSYITAASTPEDVEVGYVFENCDLTAEPDVQKVYLGRPWRPYAQTAFINCNMGNHIRPEGWHNWGKADNEMTARYSEYGSKGPGAEGQRVAWAKKLTKEDVAKLTDLKKVYHYTSDWTPTCK